MGVQRYVNAVRNFDDVAVELLWRLGREQHNSTQPASWTLPEGLSSELLISWPATYDWEPTERWLCHLLAGFRNLVRVDRADISGHPLSEGCIVTQFSYRGRSHRVAIDFSDYMDRICQQTLKGTTVYFKMQYRRGGYGDDKIIPGGYPVSSPYGYRFLPKLRQNCDVKPKRYNVYGRFGLRYSAELRQKAMAALSEAKDLGYEGGTRFVRNSRYLRDMARSKIGIDLPGNGDFCFRLIDYLSIGVCVIGPRPRTELPVPLVDGEHIVYCRDDVSDLVSLCRRFLNDDQERARIARNARDHFDRFLHRDQMARYYLNRFLAAAA